MSIFQKLILCVTILGAINWGLVGLFEFDFVSFLFGNMTFLTKTIYVFIASCGLINIALLSLKNYHKLETI